MVVSVEVAVSSSRVSGDNGTSDFYVVISAAATPAGIAVMMFAEGGSGGSFTSTMLFKVSAFHKVDWKVPARPVLTRCACRRHSRVVVSILGEVVEMDEVLGDCEA